MIRYGAKSLPYGGWWALPPLAGDGWMILGDSAGFLNSARLKGIHLAIKSGMLAAETAFEALKKDDASAAACLGSIGSALKIAGSKKSSGRSATFIRDSNTVCLPGCSTPACNKSPADAASMPAIATRLATSTMKSFVTCNQTAAPDAHLIGPAKGDGKLTFDKLTDLYHSGTKHEEDQPSHLIIHDTNVCNTRCVKEFGNPCQNFCPANVYEMVDDATQPNGKRISLNAANCVHCKTCDIADPYQIITWVPPEGGGGTEL